MINKLELREAQKRVDEGNKEGEWKVLEYNGYHSPCVIRHKCGKEKSITRFSTLRVGRIGCEVCNPSPGRPKKSFEETADRINKLTHGTYELVSLNNSTDFVVNHKNCDRPPFATSSMRFFTRGQRCACSRVESGRRNKMEAANLNSEKEVKPKRKQIICTTTGEIFSTKKSAYKKYHLDPKHLNKALDGVWETAGEDNGIKLQWEYVPDSEIKEGE